MRSSLIVRSGVGLPGNKGASPRIQVRSPKRGRFGAFVRFWVPIPGINRSRKDVMPRFKLNRWWILILTLSLVCTLAASQSTYAAPTLLRRIGDGGSGG